VGGYYETQDTGFAQITGPDWIDPIGYDDISHNHILSEAIFGQATYKVTDQLDLTVGARYNYDQKVANSNVYLQTIYSNLTSKGGPNCGTPNFYYAAFVAGSVCGGNYIGAATHNWYDFDPRVQVDYHLTPDVMAYFNFTGGYNAGGFNQQLGANLGGGLVPYGRERIYSYEGGLKTEWFEHRLRVNADGFYQTYDNLQASITVTYNGVSTRAVQNAASAHEDGAELEVEVLPTPDLVVRANGAYLDQHYDKIAPTLTSITLTTPLNSAPRFEGSVALDYTFHLQSDATLTADANYRWVGPKPSCTPLGTCSVPAYGLLGARLTYTSSDGVWSVAGWATNLLDKLYYTSYTAGPNTNMGETAFQPGVPREFGAEIHYNFGGPTSTQEPASTYTPPPVKAPMAAVAHSYMVFFDFNKSDLSAQAVAIVDQAAKNAGPAKATELVVTGHTDTVGSDAYNMRLSLRRAESVAAELEKQGIKSSEIDIIAKGKKDLLVPTADGVREPQNRRVTILYAGATS
jgi:iron complex outermembrane receptor protein